MKGLLATSVAAGAWAHRREPGAANTPCLPAAGVQLTVRRCTALAHCCSSPSDGRIGFSSPLMPPLADQLGEAGLAWDVAHGHAQHLQVSIPGLLQRAPGDALRIARQADGHASATPAGLPSPVFNNRDIRHRLWPATMPGVHGYAPRTHHDAGKSAPWL